MNYRANSAHFIEGTGRLRQNFTDAHRNERIDRCPAWNVTDAEQYETEASRDNRFLDARKRISSGQTARRRSTRGRWRSRRTT